MNLTFDKYKYIGAEDPNKTNKQDYAFDDAYFNGLISSKRYIEAAKYAEDYSPIDPEERRQHDIDIAQLKNQGRKIEAIYSYVGMKKDVRDALDFKDAVFKPGALSQLEDNDLANEFIKFKEKLGSAYVYSDDPNNLQMHSTAPDKLVKATRLQIGFAPEKQTFITDNWLGDILARDNSNNIDNFLRQSGYTEDMLKQAGVKVERNKDGYGWITFDKNIDISNELIYKLASFADFNDASYGEHKGFSWSRNLTVKGFDSDGKEIKRTKSRMLLEQSNARDFIVMKRQIDDAIDKSNKAIDDIKTNKNLYKNYSSTKMSLASDDLVALEESYANGEVTPSQYKSLRNYYVGELDHFVKTLNTKDMVIYSDYDYDSKEEKYEDMSLHEVPQEYNGEVAQMLSEANTNRLHYDVQMSNGQIGLLVTVDGKANDKGEKIYDKKQIWIPMDERYGALYGKLKRKIDSDTYSRSAQEINDMQDYGYDYTTRNGNSVSVNNGTFYIDGQETTKEGAIKAINKDMIIDSAVHNIKYKYMNEEGNLIDIDGLNDISMKTAIAAVNELSPEIPLAHLDGKPLTLEEIITNTENLTRAREEENYALYRKLKEIYDVYNEIISSVTK